jgi:HD-GYP domain-containing protein (c-di-GMP phosphodiesterase class II)
MKSIAASLLKPGMVFTEPIYIDSNSILVPAKIPIRQKDLDNLQIWGIESVLTDGLPSFIDPVVPEEKSRAPGIPLDSSILGPAGTPIAGRAVSIFSLGEVRHNRGPYRSYISLIERANMALLRIHTRENLHDNRQITTLASDILQVVRDQRERFACFVLGGEVKGYEMAKSSVNTAILSAMMAHELKLPNHKVLNVVIGALLHDAGMLRLPREIIDKKGELSEQERQVMRSHPQLTHKIVTKELNYSDDLGEIVLQHHERWDGEGYPHHLVGDRIDLGARIVSIADAFEAMVSQKPYRNPITGYQAMKNLLSDNSRRFDPELLKAFILIMGIYPIGSVVSLNNGTIVRVTEARAIAPLRPKTQVLLDEFKKPPKSRVGVFIDLLIEKNLYITKAMTAKELSELDA